MRITQAKDIRSANRREVFRCVLRHYPLSRQELCGRTGLTKSTVSVIVKEWMELGLLDEGARVSSGAGRKHIMLEPAVDAGYAIAIDFDVNRLEAIACDLTGEHVLGRRVASYTTTSFPEVRELLFATLDALVAEQGACRYGLIGIGIAFHGVVDLAGTIRFVPTLDWHNIDLRGALEERYGVPVSVDSDGNYAALVQQRAETAGADEAAGTAPIGDLALVTVGDTVSGGQIINGQVLRGHHGFANAIGHHTVRSDEPVACRCGRHGCWEQYCSDRAVIAYANTLLDEPITSMDELIRLIRDQDPAGKAALDYFVENLAIGLTNIIFIFDTELIAVNSRLLNAFPYYLPEVKRRMTLPITHSEAVVLAAKGERGAILGAADAAIERFLDELALREGD